MATARGEVTDLLIQLKQGNRDAQSRLMPLVYAELRRVASRYMRGEQPGHTLQSTDLVHEAYIRLAGQNEISWQNRAHFFGVAANVMRRILVDHARAKRAKKRGGSDRKVSIDDAILVQPEPPHQLLALDEATTGELIVTRGVAPPLVFGGNSSTSVQCYVKGLAIPVIEYRLAGGKHPQSA